MQKKSTKNKANTTNGSIMVMLRKVVPFFFSDPKAKLVRSVSSKPSTTKTATQKKIGSSKKTSRLPAATLSARKSVQSPIHSRPKGRFIFSADTKKVDAKAITKEILSDVEEDAFLSNVALEDDAPHFVENMDGDSFLSKVSLKEKDTSVTKKIGAWTLLASRFFGGPTNAPSTQEMKPDIDPKDFAEDSFLRRVQKKEIKAVVGTAIDEDAAEGLEELASTPQQRAKDASGQPFKGGLLSAADLRKETQAAKEATARLEKEVKEIKQEMKKDRSSTIGRTSPIDTEKKVVKVEEVPVTVHVGKNIGQKKKNGLQQFTASIGYIGLGKERSQFIQNLATMLNAGLPLIEAIKTLQMETKPKTMKQLLQRVVDMVDNGSPLWRALEAQSFFSPHSLALIRIGEEAGNLAGNMEYLAAQDEKDHELRSKVQMAMIYPIIVLSIMAVIVVVLGMFVLPNLIGVLTSLNVPLPLATRIVIKVSNAFTDYGYIGIPCSLVGVFVLMILNKYTSLKIVVQWITFRIPGVGKLARQATIARFGVILGGLLKAGVPVTEALDSLIGVTTIVVYHTFYVSLLDHINVGDSFSKSFGAIKHSDKLLPPSVQQLVITGEKSGALADIMLKISDIYDKKATETAQKLPVILEPLLLLFIGSLVGTIAFAILVPIYSIVGNIGH